MVDFQKMHRMLERALNPNRYEHTLGVAYTAAALAMRYDYDVEKARIAGLLHDCAKCIPEKKRLKLCKQYQIPLTEAELASPGLIHAKLGAYVAQDKYGITDPEILSAITWHTTGRPEMSLLEKIIYISDYIEPRRHKAVRLAQIRKTAFLDLDQALMMILEDSISYLNASGKKIDLTTQNTYDYYVEKSH